MYLVLLCMAANHAFLTPYLETSVTQGDVLLTNILGCGYFDANVVEGISRALPAIVDLEKHQFHGRIGNLEVRVTGAPLMDVGPEGSGVELDRGVEVGDVQSQLHSRHDVPSLGGVVPA